MTERKIDQSTELRSQDEAGGGRSWYHGPDGIVSLTPEEEERFFDNRDPRLWQRVDPLRARPASTDTEHPTQEARAKGWNDALAVGIYVAERYRLDPETSEAAGAGAAEVARLLSDLRSGPALGDEGGSHDADR